MKNLSNTEAELKKMLLTKTRVVILLISKISKESLHFEGICQATLWLCDTFSQF